MNLIETHNLSFSFGKYPVLKNIDLEVPAASIFGFLGPNGAGKTTTIKVLLGLLRVPAGMVNIFGQDIRPDRIEILTHTGAMVEAPSLYEHLSARRNIEITRRLRGVSRERTQEVIDIVKLSNDAHRKVKTYSTGMKQRLSLAMALLSRPALLILDEPINGLDPGGIIEIRRLLQELNQDHGVTIFLSSHILGEIEKLCTHVAVIHKGSLMFQGGMESLLMQRTGMQKVIIDTPDREKAYTVLDGRFLVVLTDHHLEIQCTGKADIAKAVHLLVESGCGIYQVKSEESDLEGSFLDLVKE